MQGTKFDLSASLKLFHHAKPTRPLEAHHGGQYRHTYLGQPDSVPLCRLGPLLGHHPPLRRQRAQSAPHRPRQPVGLVRQQVRRRRSAQGASTRTTTRQSAKKQSPHPLTPCPQEESESDSAAPTAIQTLDLPPTDDPIHLTHLLTYLYTRHLPSLADPSNPSEPQAEACLRLLALYDLSNRYAVPTLSATAAARIKTILADLYAIARDLLTAFVPLLYDGRVLTAGDPGGLRAFVAERAARDRLEGVAGCEVGKWVREFPEFGGTFSPSFSLSLLDGRALMYGFFPPSGLPRGVVGASPHAG